jgi:2-oxoglutarate dehydrogenase E2 component (dihydrolipoamide succinyltransferase)
MATGTVVDVVMPQMGVSVSEGTITRWLRNVGDTISADEPLLEISTDKVDTEVPSPGSGVLQEILVQEGETVPVGTLVARIGAGDAPAAPTPPTPETPETPEPLATPAEPEPEPAAAEPEPVPAEPEPAVEEPAPTPAAAQPSTAGNGAAGGERHAFVSPVVARIASEHGIDPSSVPGTGRDGRVTKKDILAFVESAAAEAAPQPAAPVPPAPVAPAPAAQPPAAPPPADQAAPAPAAPVAAPPPAASPAAAGSGETVEPMTPMRRGIAEHMRRSLDTAAHVTSAIEVDMSKVVSIRQALKGPYRDSYGVNLTYLAFISRAAVETLREWPFVNAEIRGESIVTHSYVNLGFAVALDGGKGLIVPVLKNAESLNLLGMARGVADLAERARTKKLLPDDVQGGTFTITNPGSYGTFIGTPVISQPQTGILGTYAVVKRPWVITDDAGNDAIAIRPMMNLTLTYDHRLVDGAYAGQFLRDLTARLQGWGESDY